MEGRHSRDIYVLLLAAVVALALPWASSAIDSRSKSGPPCFLPPKDLTHPPRSAFINTRQYEAYKAIQIFKGNITCDPKDISKYWVGPEVCKYKGFYCAPAPGTNEETVAAVDLNSFEIAAPVEGFIDGLHDLAIFHLNTCNCSGKIPPLDKLKYVYELDLSNNKWGLPLPIDAIGKLTQLAFLDLRYNHWNESIPKEIFEYKPKNKTLRFDVLFLNNNNLTGRIPASIGSTPVKYLTLANNRLTGPIPSTIGGTAKTLKEVLFLGNQLSGCLPWQIGKLRKATVIDVGNNRIEGPIPKSLGCLKSVEQLNLTRNRFYGKIPDRLCRLGLSDHPWGTGRLAKLDLSYNYLTSLGGPCKWLLKKGILNVDKNCIPEKPNQRPPHECTEFRNRPEAERTCYPDGTEKKLPCKRHHALQARHNWDDHGAKAMFLAAPAPAPSPSVAYGALHVHRP